MGAAERSVLHVLPHPGGGGETYVDTLEEMEGYGFTRVYLAPSPAGAMRHLPRGVAAAFVRARGHDLVHVHGEVAGGVCLPLLAARPSIVTLHGLHLVRRLHGARRVAAELNLRAVVRAAGSTICVAETELAELTSVLGPRASERASVIPNGVPMPAPVGVDERTDVRSALGLNDDHVVAIWVGSLDERKDPVTAVRAAVAASVRLLVVGDGPLRPALERQPSPLVRILGRRGDVARLLAVSDIFVHTARREGLSLSLLEAMARGLAVVVADVPENLEAVGNAGVAVSPGTVDALAVALRRLAANPDERAALGERARARAAERFGAATMVARTRAVYDQVVGDS